MRMLTEKTRRSLVGDWATCDPWSCLSGAVWLWAVATFSSSPGFLLFEEVSFAGGKAAVHGHLRWNMRVSSLQRFARVSRG